MARLRWMGIHATVTGLLRRQQRLHSHRVGLVVIRRRVGEVTFVLIQGAALSVGVGILRIELNRFVVIGERASEVTLRLVGGGAIRIGLRIRRDDFDSLAEVGDRRAVVGERVVAIVFPPA